MQSVPIDGPANHDADDVVVEKEKDDDDDDGDDDHCDGAGQALLPTTWLKIQY